MQKNVNTFVGTVGTKRETWQTIKDETFYLTDFTADDYVLPMIMSEFFFEVYRGKRVKVYGFPRETRRRLHGQRRVFTYIYVVHLELADDEEPDCRYVEIEGKVASRNGKVELGSDMDSKIHFELEYTVTFDKDVIITTPCRAFSKVARRLSNIQKGDPMLIRGNITGGNGALRVAVKNFEKLHEEEVDTNVG